MEMVSPSKDSCSKIRLQTLGRLGIPHPMAHTPMSSCTQNGILDKLCAASADAGLAHLSNLHVQVRRDDECPRPGHWALHSCASDCHAPR